jgi:hypothetical protein
MTKTDDFTAQTFDRRFRDTVEGLIVDEALGWHHRESPDGRIAVRQTTDEGRPAYEGLIDGWNAVADALCRRLMPNLISWRIVRKGAGTFQFESNGTAATVPELVELGSVLRDLAGAIEKKRDNSLPPPDLIYRMARLAWICAIPRQFFKREAHVKDGLYDRTLRHQRKNKVRKWAMAYGEQLLAVEDQRQRDEFVDWLRDVTGRDRRLGGVIRADRTFGDFFVARPGVRVTQLANKKSAVLVPPPNGSRRILPKITKRDP